MPLFNHFPYTNMHELNIDWAIEKIRELIAEGEALYTELQSWKTDTDAGLAEWKTQMESDLSEWETATAAELERSVNAVINNFTTWWTNNRADLEQLVTDAETAATTAQGALDTINGIYADFMAYTNFVDLSAGTPNASASSIGSTVLNTYEKLERHLNTITVDGHVDDSTSTVYLWNVIGGGDAGSATSLDGTPNVSVLSEHIYRVSFIQNSGSWVSDTSVSPRIGVYAVDTSASPSTRTSLGSVRINETADFVIPAGLTHLCVAFFARYPASGGGLAGTTITYTDFVASIVINDVTDEVLDDTINVLTVGSSFLQDSVAYAGKILNGMGKHVRLYNLYRASTSCWEYLAHSTDSTWDDTPVYLNRWEPQNSAWVRETGFSLDDVLAMHKWNIVYGQNAIAEGDKFTPFYDHCVTIAHDFIFISGGQLLRDSYEGDDNMADRVRALKAAALDHGCVERWVPGSFAFQACANTSTLQAIAGIQNPGMPWGIYETSGTTMHQMAGLPAIINAYAFAEMICRIGGISASIAGDAWVPTQSNCTAIAAGPMTHGNSIGATSANIRMAQKAVMAAYKNNGAIPEWSDTYGTYTPGVTP